MFHCPLMQVVYVLKGQRGGDYILMFVSTSRSAGVRTSGLY